MLKQLAITLFLVVAINTPQSAKATTINDKVALQAAMTAHIEASLIDGVMPHVELSAGTLVNLVPTKAHPMILSFGENYVLCTDFRDPKGEFVNVDFYVTRKDDRFVVFQTEINNREPLKQLMGAGKVAAVK